MKRFRIFLTKEQKTRVGEDIETIKERADKLRDRHNSKSSDRAHEANRTCPNCGNKDPRKIVNKISRVQGQGEVSGGLFFVYGSSETDTNEVNHCNDCGNQWKKEKPHWLWISDTLESCIRSLNTQIEKKNDVFWSSDVENIKVFRGMCVESIMHFERKHGSKWRSPLVTKKSLKSYYHSVKET